MTERQPGNGPEEKPTWPGLLRQEIKAIGFNLALAISFGIIIDGVARSFTDEQNAKGWGYAMGAALFVIRHTIHRATRLLEEAQWLAERRQANESSTAFFYARNTTAAGLALTGGLLGLQAAGEPPIIPVIIGGIVTGATLGVFHASSYNKKRGV